jgi:signal transduction histidine kinase
MALNLELLEEELGPGQKEARDLLSAIGGEVERLTGLSEEYLSVARRQPLRLEEEDLGQLVREAAEFMRRDLSYHGVETRLELDSHVRQARVDEAQLKQALFNLLRNAREAMPNGGAVTVGVRPAADGGVDITVDDQGSGIDEHVRERLFEPFFTTKDHGTGLGLAITRQIVQGHGGEIRCLPRDSGGTRIWIHLPAVRPAAPVETAPAEQRDAV